MSEAPDTITVGDLVEKLQSYDLSLPVFVQSDPEGNAYRAAGGADRVFAMHEYGELWEVIGEDEEEERTDEHMLAVVIFP